VRPPPPRSPSPGRGGGNETDWSIKGAAAALTAAYDVIVIMPYGTDASLWTNWYNEGDSSIRQYETHHLVELRDILEADYRANGGYAIAGLSSGGFGALSYAARRPDMFSAMASMSGSQDRNYHDVAARRVIDGMTTVSSSGGPLYGYWGGPVTQEVRWRDHNPIDLAPNLEGVTLDVAWGNGLPGPLVDSYEVGDPVETAVNEPNLYLMSRFADLEAHHGKDLDYHNGYYGSGRTTGPPGSAS
jgi:S-formylglutathione hydrolase FrmB